MIKKPATLLWAVALALLILSPVAALAQLGPTRPIGLPSSTGRGLATAVGFQPSWYGRGSFYGIRVVEVAPYVTRVVIRQQFGRKATIYDGPVSPGQFIPFSDTRIIWIGYRSRGGSHMNGIKVLPLYR